MIVGLIQASSQKDKNSLLYETLKETKDNEVINFGCFPNEDKEYSYIEISIEIGLLLASKAVDFVVTGCSSGQGMMLACDVMPGVICGYAPTPQDAYLFAQINNGNAISLPLGEEYTYKDDDNLKQTIKKLFSEPFGQGYPPKDAKRNIKDSIILKDLKEKSNIDIITLLNNMDKDLLNKALERKNVIDYIVLNGKNKELVNYIKQLNF